MSKLTEIQQAFVVLDAATQEILNATDRELKMLVGLLKLTLPIIHEAKASGLLYKIQVAIQEYEDAS